MPQNLDLRLDAAYIIAKLKQFMVTYTVDFQNTMIYEIETSILFILQKYLYNYKYVLIF